MAEVEVDEGLDQVQVERLLQLLGVALGDVATHFVVDFGLGLAGAVVGGHGLAEDGLAGLLVDPLREPLEKLFSAGGLGGLLELDLHALGEYCGGIAPKVGDGGLKDLNIFGEGVGAVLADAQRHSEDLHEGKPILEVVHLGHVGPGDQAGEAAADRDAALQLGEVDDEFVGRQLDALQHVRFIEQAQFCAGHPVEGEEAGIAPFVRTGEPPFAALVPVDLYGRVAFAQSVEQVFLQGLVAGAFDQLAHGIGNFNVLC